MALPNTLTNLWGWWKADAGVTGTTTVTAWADQSGNGRTLTSVSTNEPAKTASALNSLPVISALGKSVQMATGVNGPNLSAGGTLYIVARQVASGAVTTGDSGGAYLGMGSDVNLQLLRGDTTNTGIASVKGGIDGNYVEIGGVNDANYYTIRLRNDGTNTYISINNGSEQQVADGASGYTATPLTVFNSLSAPYGNKAIAEIIIYTENHDSTKRGIVESYLQQKYLHYNTTSVITFGALPQLTVGTVDYAPGATSNSPATINYVSSNTAVATIVSGKIHVLTAGTTNITASQASTTGYTIPTPVIQSLTVNPNIGMSTTVNGDLILLEISTVLTSPQTSDWKEVVCSENGSLDGSADTTKKKTKCGTLKQRGPADWAFSGTGVLEADPANDQLTAQDLATLFQDGTPILARFVHGVDSTIYKRQGQGFISKYSEKGNVGDLVQFDFGIEFEGDLTLS